MFTEEISTRRGFDPYFEPIYFIGPFNAYFNRITIKIIFNRTQQK